MKSFIFIAGLPRSDRDSTVPVVPVALVVVLGDIALITAARRAVLNSPGNTDDCLKTYLYVKLLLKFRVYTSVKNKYVDVLLKLRLKSGAAGCRTRTRPASQN